MYLPDHRTRESRKANTGLPRHGIGRKAHERRTYPAMLLASFSMALLQAMRAASAEGFPA